MSMRMIGARLLTKEEKELALLYGKPVTVYHILQAFSRDKPRFLSRCLNYKMQAKKNKMINPNGHSVYNYMGSNNEILRSQVVEKTSCPICQMKCGSLVGVRHHLTASHALLNFNFRLSENRHPNFDVSVKPDAFKNGVLIYDLGEHPRVNYYYCSKSRMRGQRVDRMGKCCKIFEKYADVVPRDNANEFPPHVNGDNISPVLALTHLSENSNDIQTITQPEIGQSSKANGPPVNGDNVSSSLTITRLSRKTTYIQTRTQPKRDQSSKAKGSHVNGDNMSSSLTRTPLSRKTTPIQTRTQPKRGQSSKPKGPHVNGDNISSSLPRTPLSRMTTQIQTRTQPKRGQSSKAKGPHVNGDSISSPLARTRCLSRKTTQIQTITQPKRGQSSKAKGPGATRRKMIRPKRIETERTDLLRSRQFYHSRTLQPMTLEEVMSDADSDSERDEDFQDIQELMKLDQLVDASDEQKRFMWLWNTFKRRQRVLADKHVPWACQEFVKFHAKELIKPKMFWQWKSFAIDTLLTHGLICAKTMDKCSLILQRAQEKEEEPTEAEAEALKAAHAAAAAAAFKSYGNGNGNVNEPQPMELDEEQH